VFRVVPKPGCPPLLPYQVFAGEIDRIVGVAIAKDVLMYAMNPALHLSMKVADLMEPTYFVPESMRVQAVLEEMRR
jgi:Mg2+/Co2+ transporter CorC